VVEEVLELVHLGLGGDAMEGDGKVGAAAGPVRGEVQRVLPISARQDKSRSILRHSGIRGAADEAVLNTVHRQKIQKNPPC
jgi:hypothetical protein